MGLLSDKYIKDRNKKFWIQIFLDIFLIIILLIISLNARTEFENGYKFAMSNCLLPITNMTEINKNITIKEYMNISKLINNEINRQ